MQNGADARVIRRRFDNATPLSENTQTSQGRHKITLATVRVLCDDVNFCDGPGILQAKSRIPVLTARELPC